MRTWARWTARATLFAASFATAGITTVGIASAGTHVTSGNNSILGGNQVNVPVSIPVDVCGNAAALLGTALAGCQGGAFVGGGHGGSGGSTWITSGNHSIGGGNQVSVPVKIPVDVCGNAAAVLGTALAGCQGGAFVGGSGSGGSSGGGSWWTTSGNHSIGGGNQVNVPVKIPVSVCGNAAAVLGGALAGCAGGASTGTPGGGHWSSGGYMPRHMSAAHVVRQSAQTTPLSGVSSLSGIPVLGGLPLLSGLSGGSPASNLPVQTNLTSYSAPAQTPASAPGMGSGSMLAIAVGAVLAGAAALVAAGRRLSLRKAGR
jgi:hypothetical protein